MPNLLNRLFGGRSPVAETKAAQMLMRWRELGEPDWTRRSFPALAQEGFARNPVVHRCVRLIAEAANARAAGGGRGRAGGWPIIRC